MFFVLSKTVGFFGHPSNLMFACGLLGLVLVLTRWRRAATVLMAVSILGIGILGLSPVSNLLMTPLIERFPAWQAGARDPDGIIVLGGAIDTDQTADRPNIELNSAAERVVAMLELARRYPRARVVFTGGSANLLPDSAPEAPAAQNLMVAFGEHHDRLIIEDKSRTTYENAIYTKTLVAPKPGEQWLLVTSAFHMPRSVGAFRQAGFDVVAYPVDWRVEAGAGRFRPFERISLGLSMADVAVHEWVGLGAYWLTGKSSALLPKP